MYPRETHKTTEFLFGKGEVHKIIAVTPKHTWSEVHSSELPCDKEHEGRQEGQHRIVGGGVLWLDFWLPYWVPFSLPTYSTLFPSNSQHKIGEKE